MVTGALGAPTATDAINKHTYNIGVHKSSINKSSFILVYTTEMPRELTNPVDLAIHRSSIALFHLLQEMTWKQIETLRVARLACLLSLGGINIPLCLQQRITNLLTQRQHADGGWADTVDTLWCAAFFKEIGEQDLLQRALENLESDRHSNGAWGRSRRDMSRIPVTCLIGMLFPNMILRTTQIWLLDEWQKELQSSTGGLCANYKAAYVILALNKDHPDVPGLQGWLADQREADGGWAPWNGHPIGSQTLYTGLAILALNYNSSLKMEAVCKAGIRFLCETQKPFGLWQCHHIDEGSAWAWRALLMSRKEE